MAPTGNQTYYCVRLMPVRLKQQNRLADEKRERTRAIRLFGLFLLDSPRLFLLLFRSHSLLLLLGRKEEVTRVTIARRDFDALGGINVHRRSKHPLLKCNY
jgi:hypothetical protein